MSRSVSSVRHFAAAYPVRFALIGAFLIGVQGLVKAEPLKSSDESSAKDGRTVEIPVEVRFTDNSVLKLFIRDDKLEFLTEYGKLYIPVADVRRIECGLRVTDDVAKRVDAAVEDLGNSQFRRREAASAILLALREKAFPAVMRATKHHDMEVSTRAEELVKKFQETVPADLLKTREYDIIYTDKSKIAGRIEGASLRATTSQFGDVQLRLADVYTMTSKGVETVDMTDAAAAPSNMINFHSDIGKTFTFKVTANSSGSVWGTDIYTTDSTLATVVIHAGLLQPGQTGVVKVTMMQSPNVFVGSTRNGITSTPYQQYPAAYRVHKE
jgi:hypothetical protein